MMGVRRMLKLPAFAFAGLRYIFTMGAYIKRFDSNMNLKRCDYVNPEHNYV